MPVHSVNMKNNYAQDSRIFHSLIELLLFIVKIILTVSNYIVSVIEMFVSSEKVLKKTFEKEWKIMRLFCELKICAKLSSLKVTSNEENNSTIVVNDTQKQVCLNFRVQPKVVTGSKKINLVLLNGSIYGPSIWSPLLNHLSRIKLNLSDTIADNHDNFISNDIFIPHFNPSIYQSKNLSWFKEWCYNVQINDQPIIIITLLDSAPLACLLLTEYSQQIKSIILIEPFGLNRPFLFYICNSFRTYFEEILNSIPNKIFYDLLLKIKFNHRQNLEKNIFLLSSLHLRISKILMIYWKYLWKFTNIIGSLLKGLVSILCKLLLQLDNGVTIDTSKEDSFDTNDNSLPIENYKNYLNSTFWLPFNQTINLYYPIYYTLTSENYNILNYMVYQNEINSNLKYPPILTIHFEKNNNNQSYKYELQSVLPSGSINNKVIPCNFMDCFMNNPKCIVDSIEEHLVSSNLELISELSSNEFNHN